MRRCSIGSASSLQGREENGNNGNGDEDAHSEQMDRLGLGDLGIRRVSDISHINEIRREVKNLAVYIYNYIYIYIYKINTYYLSHKTIFICYANVF